MVKKLLKRKLFTAGFAIVAILSLLSLAAPILCPIAPDIIDSNSLLMPPSSMHLFGTDQLGRDVFSRVIYGGRVSLSVGVVIILIATSIGMFLGAVSGYFGGILDYIIMRFTDIMLCFPVFFLILAVIAMLEPSVFNIIFILGLTGWMGQARLIRAEILSLKRREFVLAAKAYGASNTRIIIKHLIPNSLGPVLVAAVLGVANAIMVESALSFLGIGIQPPTPSWGNILSEAKATLGMAWWLSFFPGMAILLAILGCNLMGEGLRDCLSKKS